MPCTLRQSPFHVFLSRSADRASLTFIAYRTSSQLQEQFGFVRFPEYRRFVPIASVRLGHRYRMPS
jgi:hypothetical protein